MTVQMLVGLLIAMMCVAVMALAVALHCIYELTKTRMLLEHELGLRRKHGHS